MKFAKISTTALLLVFGLFVFVSCKKDTPTPVATYPIQGLWTGSYLVTGATTSSYYSFVIKPDGTLIVDSKAGTVQHISLGTWTVSGVTLTCNYTCIYGSAGSIGLTQSSTATWDNSGKLTGTWQNINGVTASGTLTLTRVN